MSDDGRNYALINPWYRLASTIEAPRLTPFLSPEIERPHYKGAPFKHSTFRRLSVRNRPNDYGFIPYPPSKDQMLLQGATTTKADGNRELQVAS